MKWILILNTILSILGVIAGSIFMMGTLISVVYMKVSWASTLLDLSFLLPILFIITTIATWVFYLKEKLKWIYPIMAFPWIISILFLIAWLNAFEAN